MRALGGICGAAALFAAASAVLLLALPGRGQSNTSPAKPLPLLNQPVIDYFNRKAEDAVARLRARIQSGEAKLDYDPKQHGYLKSLLLALDINIDSQVLVFAKNSFQGTLISPQSPRAIYFNDTVALGFVNNSDILELAALDANQGFNFYLVENKPGALAIRDEGSECLQCHLDESTKYVAGPVVMSVYPAPDGTGSVAGFKFTDHRTPLEDRWGGWYVSGTHGSQHHLGNAVARDPFNPTALETEGTQNLTSLASKVDLSGYLAPTSDIVALMTLEHQTRMTNLITLVGWLARVNSAGAVTESTARELDASIEELVTYMLFADEARLHEPVKGVSSFTKTFPQRGPHDARGRSLRDFDLRERLFRYPLSYMIYTPAFDNIPAYAKEKIYRRLFDVLTGKDESSKFAVLSAADRRAVLEILRDTKPDLPAYWK